MKQIIILVPNQTETNVLIAYTAVTTKAKYVFVYVNCKNRGDISDQLQKAKRVSNSDYSIEQLEFMLRKMSFCDRETAFDLEKLAKKLKGQLPVDAFNADKILVIDATDIPQSQEVDEKIYKPQTEAVLF